MDRARRGLAEWVMRLLIPALLALVLPSATLADPPDRLPGQASSFGIPISPQAFEDFATGKTLAYAQDGLIWGRETYLPGRRVLWRAVGQDCRAGHWDPVGQSACFTYDDGTAPQCWAFARTPTGLAALFLNDAGQRPAQVVEEPGPLACPGPKIGS